MHKTKTYWASCWRRENKQTKKFQCFICMKIYHTTWTVFNIWKGKGRKLLVQTQSPWYRSLVPSVPSADTIKEIPHLSWLLFHFSRCFLAVVVSNMLSFFFFLTQYNQYTQFGILTIETLPYQLVYNFTYSHTYRICMRQMHLTTMATSRKGN